MASDPALADSVLAKVVQELVSAETAVDEGLVMSKRECSRNLMMSTLQQEQQT